jgi:hypothetical protein
LSFVVVAFEGSDRYVDAAVTVVAALILAWPKVPNGWRPVTTANGCRWFKTMTSAC